MRTEGIIKPEYALKTLNLVCRYIRVSGYEFPSYYAASTSREIADSNRVRTLRDLTLVSCDIAEFGCTSFTKIGNWKMSKGCNRVTRNLP